jgi:hypothetical protein
MVFYGRRYDQKLFQDIIRGSKTVNELCINIKGVHKKDIDNLRKFMWENGKFVKFNVYDSDEFIWFVRVEVLEEMKGDILSKGLLEPMDYDVVEGINTLLMKPLEYEWSWWNKKKDRVGLDDSIDIGLSCNAGIYKHS